MAGSDAGRRMDLVVPPTSTLPSSRASSRRDLALERPRRVGRWVAGVAAVSAAVITGVVAHQLPGASSTAASGSSSSSGSTGATGASGSSSGATGSSGSAGSNGAAAGQPQTVSPSYSSPVVVSGGSSVR